jgi:hypothetical protein
VQNTYAVTKHTRRTVTLTKARPVMPNFLGPHLQPNPRKSGAFWEWIFFGKADVAFPFFLFKCKLSITDQRIHIVVWRHADGHIRYVKVVFSILRIRLLPIGLQV